MALFLSFSKSRHSRKGNVPPDHVKFLFSFFHTKQFTEKGGRNPTLEMPPFLPLKDFSVGFSVLPVPDWEHTSEYAVTGACMLCCHCAPAACYSRNVVKHLRESVTNTVSVRIQTEALEQELISSHPAAPK